MSEELEKSVSPTKDSLIEKILDHDSSSSSSDSEHEKPESPSALKAKIYRLFGREKPVHKVLGGGLRMFFHLCSNLCFNRDYLLCQMLESAI